MAPRAAAAPPGNKLEIQILRPGPTQNSGDGVQACAVTSSPGDSAALKHEGCWLRVKGVGSRVRLPGFKSSCVSLGRGSVSSSINVDSITTHFKECDERIR